MQSLLQDLRYALRQLWMNRGFTLLVVVTIGIGIGANTAIYSMINGIRRPLPVPHADEIVVLAAQTKGDETGFRYRFSYPAMQDFRQQADCFSDVFAFNLDLGGLSINGRAYQFLYTVVTGNYFSGLEVRPALGRLFVPGEGENPGTEPMIVLGYSSWQKRFGGRLDIVGQQIRLDGKAVRVIGVAPKDFHGAYIGIDSEGYMPLSTWDHPPVFALRDRRPLTLLGRMKPGVSLKEAQASATVVARRMEAQYPEVEKGIGVRVMPEIWARPEPIGAVADVAPVVRGFLLLLAGVVLVLACLNVANLMLVRGTVRQREMAIRAALGSGRARLIRQTLTESSLLAVLGTLAGLLLGKWGADAFAASIDLATDFPILLDFSFDWSVFAYALMAAVATALLIGVWPALRASQVEAGAALHEGGRADSAGPARQRVRSVLVIGQVAGSLVLLIVAGLFVRSLRSAETLDLGFEPKGVLNVRLNPEWAGYNEQRTKDFYRELERRVTALPGVQSAGMAFSAPLGYYNDGRIVTIEGRPVDPDQQPPAVACNSVDGSYFDTMRMAILRGRAFRESDDDHAPHVAIVNQTMAARFWPGQDPIGKRFRTGSGGDLPWWEVVGVARNSKYIALFEGELPYFYMPLAQQFMSMRVMHVRSSVPPELLSTQVESAIRGLDADVPVADLQTMRASMSGAGGLLLFRLGASEASALGILGLILAVSGVYGVVSYGAAQRTREIGIRMALGAQPVAVMTLVLRQGVFLVLGGMVVGLAGAIALVRILRQFLLLASATDPVAFGVVSLGLMVIALGACYIPARRAMRVDPMVALRHE
jgi:predicted permease